MWLRDKPSSDRRIIITDSPAHLQTVLALPSTLFVYFATMQHESNLKTKEEKQK